MTSFLKLLLNCFSSLFGVYDIYATATASHRCAEWSDEDINHTHPQWPHTGQAGMAHLNTGHHTPMAKRRKQKQRHYFWWKTLLYGTAFINDSQNDPTRCAYRPVGQRDSHRGKREEPHTALTGSGNPTAAWTRRRSRCTPTRGRSCVWTRALPKHR